MTHHFIHRTDKIGLVFHTTARKWWGFGKIVPVTIVQKLCRCGKERWVTMEGTLERGEIEKLCGI